MLLMPGFMNFSLFTYFQCELQIYVFFECYYSLVCASRILLLFHPNLD